MLTEELDYELPPERIAQTPTEPRDAARLLVDRGPGADPIDAVVRDLPDLLRPDDLIVLNDTRVLPARVAVQRRTGGAGEVLLLEPHAGPSWDALVRPSRKLKVGEVVHARDGELEFEIGEDLGGGRRVVTPRHEGTLLAALLEAGTAPLPPYIHQPLHDAERYQTVFAQRPGSVAAPTAGLHLTDRVLDRLRAHGVEIHTVELVVGLDTFRPVSTETVEAHPIHSESYEVPESTWAAVSAARAAGRRVVAVGTTTVRALESAAQRGELRGRTDLFITPGHRFSCVDVLLTNFHLPRSSLLALVEAFTGARWRDLYGAAAERGYRFLSFGDAMLLQPGGDPAGLPDPATGAAETEATSR